ncbi:Uncharacterized membrane-anchored protein [Collimonas sp. OK607]|uniref:DUF2167 domain-containing protein n=1 Tax=Collimonas sp. OK607 TaxID=1798194 RepID=UPI0008E1B0FD|nr:DUF2167 domain-containing protein [Collimonas sp. OK607]SFB15894.1 Uncharacterized membrane-anchored protein [Collimonas sp. OK607]
MKILRKFLFALTITFVATACVAQTAETKIEIKAAAAEANKVLVQGPGKIEFNDQATFSLPQDYGFVPAAAAARYLRAVGNVIDDKSLIGVIVPTTQNGNWFVTVEFKKDGYVRDDDARDWKADDMLKSLRDGTEQANASRKERGIPEVEVGGWAEAPAYDAATHRLVWSLIVRDKGEVANSAQTGVNYRTLALGRDGYLTLTMVTDLSSLAVEKPIANNLLAAIDYHNGKRYADFTASTDHVAEYGLAALVVGVAAKKIGMLAVIAAFAAKFFKIGLLAVLAFGAAIKRFFKRTPKPATPASTSNPDQPEASPFEPRQLTQSAPDPKAGDHAAEASDTVNRV